MGEAGTLLVPNLKPELATSIEFGTDLGFFQNRVRFEGTYFVVDNVNQIISNVPDAWSSGYRASNLNIGLTQSVGWEFTLGGVPVRNREWMWDLSVNVTRVRVTLKELDPNVPEIDKVNFWDEANASSWAKVGDKIGDLYDRPVLRVDNTSSPYHGYPIISESNRRWEPVAGDDNKIKVGNYNPNFVLGLNSTLVYKSFALNFTLDWRNGGKFISQTERYQREYGASKHSYSKAAINPQGREGKELRDWLVANEDKYIKSDNFTYVGGPTREMGGIYNTDVAPAGWDGCFVPGVFAVRDAQGVITGYVENLGEAETTRLRSYAGMSPWNFASHAMFPSDYIKLREVSLTYQVPQSIVDRIGGIKVLAVSVYSRNIMLWTKAKVGIDPERAFQHSASTGGRRGTQFMQGIELYNLEPWVMPVGVKLNLTF